MLFIMDYLERGYNPGIGSISAYLRSGGHSTSLVITDRTMKEGTIEERLRSLEKRPDLVAFSVLTIHWDRVQTLAAIVKRALQAPVICGGLHPTLMPEEVIQNPFVDILCRGEGEEPVLELADRMDKGLDIWDIPGLWVKRGFGGIFRGEDRIFKNPVPPVIKDIDAFPFWDREVFLEEVTGQGPDFITCIYSDESVPLVAGRGCPYNCTFCSNSALKALYRKANCNLLRRRSVPAIVAEVAYLRANFQVKAVEFWDEQFEVNLSWLEDFCQAYSKGIHIPFLVGLRPENAHPATLSVLKGAGCRMACIGIESGDERYRAETLNRKMTNKEIIDCFRNCREAGIGTLAFNIVGLPDETPEQALATVELNRQAQPDFVQYNAFRPLPGTKLYHYCLEKGYISPGDTQMGFNMPRLALNQPSMSQEDFSRIWKEWQDLEQWLKEKLEERYGKDVSSQRLMLERTE